MLQTSYEAKTKDLWVFIETKDGKARNVGLELLNPGRRLAGMGSSDFIVAINKDAEAPIFDVADLGVIGNLYDVCPALTKLVLADKD